MTATQLAIEGRLLEALNELEPSVQQPSVSWELRKEYHDIAALYDLLLDYFRQGVDDPERQSVFTQLIGRTLILCDRLEAAPLPSSEGKGTAFGEPSFWSGSEVADAIVLIRKGKDDACLLISSMTLSLLRVFDPRKMEVLCEAASSTADAIAIRAVTAIAIAVRRYGERLHFYPDVEARLRMLGSDTAFLDMLADVELQFVRSRDTEEIERRMRDDIIPSMMRSPKAKGKRIITPEDITDESNPEWMQWLKESGLEDKLRDLTELQMSGADIYMGTFSQLKSYPFFSDTANWFRPFDPAHPAVSSLFEGQKAEKSKSLKEGGLTLQRLIMRSGMFCNSDKYSFCLSLSAIPKEQLDMLQSQLAEQEEALREELGQQASQSSGPREAPSPRTLTRQYIQDLYRFFHLSPARAAYADPFADGGSQAAGDALHAFYRLPQSSLLALFELNFQRRDYPAAIASFERLETTSPLPRDGESLPAHTGGVGAGSYTLWQKYGYCHQRIGAHADALRAYRMADLLKPDHFWTLHHIAQCQRALGLTDEALESYRHLAAMKPDDPRFAYRQAECLVQLGSYDEALPILFRLAYDDPADLRTRRAIVRCQLMLRQTDAAMKQAAHLLDAPDDELTDDDRTLVAAAQWLAGQRTAAVATLHTVIRNGSDGLDGTLKALGIPAADIPFLLDLARKG